VFFFLSFFHTGYNELAGVTNLTRPSPADAPMPIAIGRTAEEGKLVTRSDCTDTLYFVWCDELLSFGILEFDLVQYTRA
jgi:hypothetical protein